MAGARDPFDERIIELFGLSPFTERPLTLLINWVLITPGMLGFMLVLFGYALALLYLPIALIRNFTRDHRLRHRR